VKIFTENSPKHNDVCTVVLQLFISCAKMWCIVTAKHGETRRNPAKPNACGIGIES